jgi:hypothetical protein
VQEVPEAVRKCQQAGILVRMITGDNLLTAKSIAREIGILTDGSSIEGPDFRKMTPEEQRHLLKNLQVPRRQREMKSWEGSDQKRRRREVGEAMGMRLGNRQREISVLLREKYPCFLGRRMVIDQEHVNKMRQGNRKGEISMLLREKNGHRSRACEHCP